MRQTHNGFATTGFILSLCAIGPLVAGFLCVIDVMLTSFIGFVFGTAAGIIAIVGFVFSVIAHHRSYALSGKGAGFSIIGVILATMVLTLVLAATALLIVAAAIA